MNSHKYSDENETVQDRINDVNPRFYHWLEKTINLHPIRAISLCTYMLNFTLIKNYFPYFDALFKEIPDFFPSNFTDEMKKDFPVFIMSSEFIFGFIILSIFRYKSSINKSIEETDQIIDELWKYEKLIIKFCVINSVSKLYRDVSLDAISDAYEYYSIKGKLFPKLDFNPDFEEVLNNDVIYK